MLWIRYQTSAPGWRKAVRTKRNIDRRRRSAGGQGTDEKKPVALDGLLMALSGGFEDAVDAGYSDAKVFCNLLFRVA
jgi:hypothetical protein